MPLGRSRLKPLTGEDGGDHPRGRFETFYPLHHNPLLRSSKYDSNFRIRKPEFRSDPRHGTKPGESVTSRHSHGPGRPWLVRIHPGSIFFIDPVNWIPSSSIPRPHPASGNDFSNVINHLSDRSSSGARRGTPLALTKIAQVIGTGKEARPGG
jgi:hypothetical protein